MSYETDCLMAELEENLRELGIPLSRNIVPQVRINTRAKRRLGCCYYQDGVYAVEVSAALLEQHRRRVRFIHIKDYLDLEQKPFPAFTAIGTGRMDNAPVLSKAKEIGAEWIVVEQDNSPIDELESARLSLQAMRAWF